MSSRLPTDDTSESANSRESLVTLGRSLRETRQKRGEDLYDIAAYLKIRPSYLFAIEDGDLDATPGLAYAIGFLRSYADYLGYDAREIVAHARQSIEGARPRAELQYLAPATDRRTPSIAIVLASIAIAGVAYGAWYLAAERGISPIATLRQIAGEVGRYASEFTSSADEVERGPGSPVATQATEMASLGLGRNDQPLVASDVEITGSGLPDLPLPEESLAALQLEAPEPPRPGLVRGDPDGARIVLLARADSWVQVKSKERDFVRTRTLLAGDRLPLPDRDDLALWTGNAGGVEILLDGESIGVLGETGAFVEGVPLLPDRLRNRRR